MINEGVYIDLSIEDYHSDKESISRSSIMSFKKSPLYYWKTYLDPERPSREKNTTSTTLGTAFHSLILERCKFDKEYAILPPTVLLKDVGREEYDRVQCEKKVLEKSGKILLSYEMGMKLKEMHLAIHNHSKAREFIYGELSEASYFWRDTDSEIMCKARPDILHIFSNKKYTYVDLKTCSDASEDAFQRSMAQYGNHIQAAMVCDGVDGAQKDRYVDTCINICIETSYPYSIGIYIIDELAIQTGREEYKRILLELKHAIRHNEWDDLPIKSVGLPRWYV